MFYYIVSCLSEIISICFYISTDVTYLVNCIMVYEMEQIAATLRDKRKHKGLSQRELSVRTGLPQPYISKIESGGVNLTVTSLTAIANALGLEIALVPRKAMPAVKAISRSLDDSRPSPRPDYRLDDEDE